MTYVSDGTTINGLNLSQNYFYNANNEAAGVTQTNGVLDYNGTVDAGGVSGLSGTIANQGNGFFTITPSGGSPTTYQILGSTGDGKNLIFETAANNGPGSNKGPYFILSNSGTAPPAGSLNYDGNNSYSTPTTGVTCFVTGTRIRTTRGPCAVEDLLAGDVAVTASGETRPIVWIGHRDADCRGHHDLQPARVAAHAFGPGLPERDLLLSPGHPVLVGADADGEGGHLVPIMCLINGTTISRQTVERVTYWHVELDQHDILLAEELPAESYLDWGDRPFFEEGSDHRLANPDFIVPGLAGRCRPVALDGPVVEAARRKLDMAFATRLTAAAAWPANEGDATDF